MGTNNYYDDTDVSNYTYSRQKIIEDLSSEDGRRREWLGWPAGTTIETNLALLEQHLLSKEAGPFFSDKTVIVWPFEDAPKVLQKICHYNGGDEDWMIFIRDLKGVKLLPTWVQNMSCSNLDHYQFNGFSIYVASHA